MKNMGEIDGQGTLNIILIGDSNVGKEDFFKFYFLKKKNLLK